MRARVAKGEEARDEEAELEADAFADALDRECDEKEEVANQSLDAAVDATRRADRIHRPSRCGSFGTCVPWTGAGARWRLRTRARTT